MNLKSAHWKMGVIIACVFSIQGVLRADGTISISCPAVTTSDPEILDLPKWNSATYPGTTLTNFELYAFRLVYRANITVTLQSGASFSTFAPSYEWGPPNEPYEEAFSYEDTSGIELTRTNPSMSENISFSDFQMPSEIAWGPMFSNNDQTMIEGDGALSFDGTRGFTIGAIGDGRNTVVVNSSTLTYQYVAEYFYSGTIVPEPASASLVCASAILLMRRGRGAGLRARRN